MGLKQVGIAVIIAVLLFGGGYMTKDLTASTASNATTKSASYPLLARRIFSSSPSDTIINFVTMRQSLDDYFNQNHLSGSLYFDYLPTGTTVQIDGDTKEVAASLMKLPAAMDAYKAVESGKVSLDKVITLQPSMLDSGYGTLYEKGAGYKLTLGDAIKIMLSQSDNTALKAVELTTFNMVSSANSSLNAVDVDLTQNQDLTVSISARSYSSFLSCLYFSCYDNYQDSQAILNDLTATDFNERLLAGITDRDVTVAHKIGVHDTDQSDCGIIYLPNRPYLLCIMLDGNDDSTTNGHIAAMSKIVYSYIKKTPSAGFGSLYSVQHP